MELLKKLTSCISPSGREDEIRNIIKNELEGFCDEIFTDALGNLICHKKGNGKKLMLAAHMDEIGFMVTFIDDNGFLRFSNVGGINRANAIDSTVQFTNGVIGKISYETKEKVTEAGFDKMYIDIGCTSKEDAEKLVKIGDFAGYTPAFYEMNNRILSKSLDDRAGCWALIKAMKALKDSPNDIYAVFTVQEEVGTRGARTAASLIKPDMAIAIDVSFSGDTPNSAEINPVMGKGPAVKIKDASFIINESVKNLLIDSAKKSSVPYQLEAANRGGTDAGAMQLTGSGCSAGTVSIPTRYIHSTTEVIDKSDLKNTSKLIKAVMETDIGEYLFN